MDITFYLFFVSLLVAFAAWCLFLWAIRTGQFHEVEEIKFQVWPGSPIDGHSDPDTRSGPETGTSQGIDPT